VAKPHPFKPDEEKKHGGKIHGKHEHHKLGRKRGGHVKKKSDGGLIHHESKPTHALWIDRDKIQHIDGEGHEHKLKHGGKVVGQDGKPSNQHGTGIPPEHGNKYITPVQDVPMADGTTPRGKYGYGKGTIEDSLKDGGKVKWIQRAISRPGVEKSAAKKAGVSTHQYMESHKHDSGKSGARARLGLRLSAMAKHKD